ncbi:MAG: hypothetical protein INH41_22560 [Myxococcaceae bacterium]|nr:hypothetical protein [Myxococcaceae bacterium]
MTSTRAPALRWTFDGTNPRADSSPSGARPIAPGLLVTVTDATAPGGAHAISRTGDSPFGTTGSGTIIAAGSNLTIEFMIRFRLPLSWQGSELAGTGGRTQLFDLGPVELNFSREGFWLVAGDPAARFGFVGGGVASWNTLADGRWHHLAAEIAQGSPTMTARLWIDGESPDEFQQPLGGVLGAITQVSPGVSYPARGVDIDELSLWAQVLPPTFISQRAREALAGQRPSDTDRCEPRQCTRVSRDAGVLVQLYEPGFSATSPYGPSTSTTDQLNTAPLPRYRRGHTMPRILSAWSTGPYSTATTDPISFTHPDALPDAGAGPTATQRQVDTLRAPEMQTLATRWNYSVCANSTGDGRSNPTQNPYTQFIRAMPASWPLELLTGTAREGDPGLGLFTDAGARLGLSPASPLATHQAWGSTNFAASLKSVETLYQRRVDLAHFDFEGETFETYQKVNAVTWAQISPYNASTASFCQGRGLSWRQCLAAGLTDVRNAIKTGALSQMTMGAPGVIYYGNSGNEPFEGDFQFTRLQNDPLPARIDPRSNGLDRFRTSSPYMYPLNPMRWYPTIGSGHGLSWLWDARRKEIQEGSPFSTPYVSAGWDFDETKIIRPGTWLGLLKLLGGSGSLTYIPGFFVIPLANGQCSWGICNRPPCGGDVLCTRQTIQNPNRRFWQTLTPAYAQGAMSRVEELVRDPAAGWLGELPVNNPFAPATGYRLGTRAVVVTAMMTSGTDMAQYQRTETPVTVSIDHDGLSTTPDRRLSLTSRLQGSVYLVDFATTPATVLQLDAWHEWVHPNWWSSDLMLDVEAADATRDFTLRSEAPGSATDDFTALTGFASVVPARATETFTPGVSAPQVEFDVEPRVAGSWSVWVRARSTGAPGSVFVWANGAPSTAVQTGCVSGSTFRWVRLDCSRGATPATLTLSAAPSVIHVAPSRGSVEIDRVVLTRSTSCIAAAPSCSCTP